MTLSKEGFFAATARRTVTAQIPGTKDQIVLRELTLGQRQAVFDLQAAEAEPERVLATAVALSADCLSLDDVDQMLETCSSDALVALANAVFDLSAMGPNAVEDAAKNSESDQG